MLTPHHLTEKELLEKVDETAEKAIDTLLEIKNYVDYKSETLKNSIDEFKKIIQEMKEMESVTHDKLDSVLNRVLEIRTSSASSESAILDLVSIQKGGWYKDGCEMVIEKENGEEFARLEMIDKDGNPSPIGSWGLRKKKEENKDDNNS